MSLVLFARAEFKFAGRAQQPRRGVVLKSGRPLDGVNDVERSLALEPRNADAHYTCGHILVISRRLDDALADYDSAIRFGGARMGKVLSMRIAVAGAL